MAYTQKERLCALTTPFGKDVLVARHVTGAERLSDLFHFQLEMVSHDDGLKAEDIVGRDVTLEIRLANGDNRYVNGYVSRFGIGGTDPVGHTEGALVAYDAEVVPWLWLLTRSSDCRVWEDKSVIEILEEVLGDPKYGDAPFEFSALSGTYEPVEYCVQYRETDFQFVSRLMEGEGLGYAFRHENGKHTMVIFDSSPSLPDCPGYSSIRLGGARAGGLGREGEIDSWRAYQELPSGKCAINGYDFTSPTEDLQAPTQSKLSMGGNAKFELYDFPPHYVSSKHGDRYVKLRMEEQEALSHCIEGEGVCAAFVTGTHVTLKGHPCDHLNDQRYLLTEVRHMLTDSIGHDSEGSTYENTFCCLPERIPYRPPCRTRKPAIPGMQTAVVVGPQGEEIHTDKYGRVRVQFPWDRQGKSDGTNVVWARVAQTAAGKKWGGMWIPRIGQEVVVQFIEGDIDRPLVTGVVYNAEQMPPYDLPANKTQSGVKTRSSKDGTPENYNEIRFEDKKGEESLSIHAEKDMSTSVENNQSTSVGADRSVTVDGNETITVKGETGRKTSIDTGDDELVVKTGDRKAEINTGKDICIVKTGNQEVTVNTGDALMEVKTGARTVTVNSADYKVETKSGNIFMDAKTDFDARAKGKALVDAPDVSVTGTSTAQVAVGQAVVKLEPAKLTLSVGSSMVILDPSGVTITGVMVKIN